VLRLEGVTKRFGAITAVRDVSFDASPGEVLGYLGPNGSGKSTTVKMITGLIAPTRGTVFFRGRDVQENLLEHRRRVGYVPESPEVYTYLSGPEYLMLVGRLRRIPTPLLDTKVERLLELFGLHDDRFARLSAYSKGMRQKISIAAALLHDPDLVVLDEPDSGLDVGSVLVLRELVRKLAERGKTVLLSSHVLELAEQVCSKVVILRDGEVVGSGPIATLRELMQKPSLEAVFTELARQPDPGRIASDIVEVIQS
jgi:ABC-2 type transport system ATP-binding protein